MQNGLSAYLDGKNNYYRNEVYRIISLFTMSMFCAHPFLDVPKDAVIAVINNTRVDGLRWREDYWGKSPLTHTCLKHVVIAFANYYNDPVIFGQSGNLRITNRGTETLASVMNSPCKIAVSLKIYYEDYLKEMLGSPKNAADMFILIVSWLRIEYNDRTIEEILTGRPPEVSLIEHFLAKKPKLNFSNANKLRHAFEFSLHIAETIHLDPSIEIWPLINEKEYKKFRLKVSDEQPSTNDPEGKIPSYPERFAPILEEILLEGESGWPGLQKMCWVVLQIEGEFKSIYCNVLPAIVLMMYFLGCRSSQARRVDSGEGDPRRYNAPLRAWDENPGRLSGYWLRKHGAINDHSKHHNYAVEFQTFTGIYLNTNKGWTPHIMEMDCHVLQLILWELRIWQEKYNPVESPIGPRLYLDNLKDYSAKTIAKFPDIFALMRIPPMPKSRRFNQPPSYNMVMNFYCLLMLEVQTRYNDRNPGETVKLINRHPKTLQLNRPVFPPHGLRSAKTTSLLKKGVPYDVVSRKVMGHKSLGRVDEFDQA